MAIIDIFKSKAVNPMQYVTNSKVVDMDDIEKIVKEHCNEDEVCSECKYWRHTSTTEMIGGSIENGRCHRIISVEDCEEDEASWGDIEKYFFTDGNSFCSWFEAK